jgi:hypothetical protein
MPYLNKVDRTRECGFLAVHVVYRRGVFPRWKMDIRLADASAIVDKFEELMGKMGVSIPQNPQTGADMLGTWYLLRRSREDFPDTVDELRPEFTATVATHDLAAKILEVSENPNFPLLIPHLSMLTAGAVHLTAEPPAQADVYNKLIELYWACLLLAQGLKIEIDDPNHSTGSNPDVITIDSSGSPAHAYAFKTIRSCHTQSVYEHIARGIEQIERSSAREGIVALHLTPRIAKAGFWPSGRYYTDWHPVALRVADKLREIVAGIVKDNGQSEIDALFAGRKAAGSVLCLAFCPIVARHPFADAAVVMPLKVATLVDLQTGRNISHGMLAEIERANHAMQIVL